MVIRPNDPRRINIVWSCLSTIFTCVYVSLHLDVPVTASDFQRPGAAAKCKAFYRTIALQGGWIAFNIIAPEIIVQVAVEEYISAKRGERMIADKRWTLAHAFFADMGGFKVQVKSQNSSFSRAAGKNEALRGPEQMVNPDALEGNGLYQG